MNNKSELFRWLTFEEYTSIYNRAYSGDGNHTGKDLAFRRLLDDVIGMKRRAAKLPLIHSDVYTSAARALSEERVAAREMIRYHLKKGTKR